MNLLESVKQFQRYGHELSKKEIIVLDALIEGCWTNIEIGEKVGITDNTVKKHFSNINSKIGISNRVQLALAYYVYKTETKELSTKNQTTD